MTSRRRFANSAVIALLLLPSAADAKEPAKDSIDFGGRIFLRGVVASEGDKEATSDLDLASARLELKYRHEMWLKLIVEAELKGRPELKDGYVRVRGGAWGLQAGHFKVPILAVEMESAWVLPVLRRGVLSDVLVDRMQIAGRRPGLTLGWKGPGFLEPTVQMGLFQGADTNGELFEETELGGHDAVVRMSIEPGDGEVGLFGEVRSSRPVIGGDMERFWAGGLDGAISAHGIRGWAELVLGSSWYDFDVFDDDEAIFLAGRLLLAWRHGGKNRGDGYLEPYGMLSTIDPDNSVGDDVIIEGVFGINVGAWRLMRASLELELRRVGDNVPPLLGEDGIDLADREAVLVQIGAAF